MHLMIDDPTELPGDDIAVDDLAEWSYENARDRYEARREERGYDMDLEEW